MNGIGDFEPSFNGGNERLALSKSDIPPNANRLRWTMRRGLRWLGISVGVSAGLAIAAAMYVYLAPEQVISRRYSLPLSTFHVTAGEANVAQGGRLVFVYGCADCHAHSLQGAEIEHFDMRSLNLTMIAKIYSDPDFDHAVRHGLRPDGTSVSEYMPADAFQFMPDSDLAALVSYIRSLPAAGEPTVAPSYSLQNRLKLVTGEGRMDVAWFDEQKPALDVGDQFKRGRELAMTACGECHTTSLGGQPNGPPDLAIVASYERADFFRLMRTGKAAGNREAGLMSQAARVRFSHFTDQEIGELFDYLQARGRKLANSGG